jgi:hypothetical protein
MQSEQIDQLATALAAAQGMMKAATFNRTNPHYKSKYADLAAVWDAIREPLAKNKLSVTQTMERVLVGDANHTELFLKTTLHHGGQWVCSYYPLPNGVQPQAFGSALTYARRYSLSAIVGIASDEDDDANEAQTAEVAPREPEVAKVVPLTEAQKDQIMVYATELSSDRMDKFLVWLNVKSLDEIGAHQYDRAISGLKKAVGRTLGGEQAAPTQTEQSKEIPQG